MAFAPVFQRSFAATFDRRAAAAAWTPASATAGGGLPVGWWKADAITGLGDGDSVASWTDSSGSGNAMLQAGANKPVYKVSIVNGLPVVRFASTQDLYTAGNINLTSGYTLAMVRRIASVIDYSGLFRISANDTDNTSYVEIYGASGLSRLVVAHNRATTLSASLFDGGAAAGWAMQIVSANASAVATRKNGALDGVDELLGTHALPSAAAKAWLGRGYFGSSGNGDIAEAVLYATALTTADQQQIEAYLTLKYGSF